MNRSTGRQLINLRSVFCGDSHQHETVLNLAKDFLSRQEPGAFIVGGTNLTGKTSLMSRIMRNSGLLPFTRSNLTNDPYMLYVDHRIGFSDENGRPGKITERDLYDNIGRFKVVPEALKRGVKTFFLDEAWAGHTQGIEFVRDELVRKHQCRVIFDVVSWGEGRGFFDGEANNIFIRKFMSSIFKQSESTLHLLNFNIRALREGVLELARTINGDKEFDISISMFPRTQRQILVDARRSNHLEEGLGIILGFPSLGDIERYY